VEGDEIAGCCRLANKPITSVPLEALNLKARHRPSRDFPCAAKRATIVGMTENDAMKVDVSLGMLRIGLHKPRRGIDLYLTRCHVDPLNPAPVGQPIRTPYSA
jgi:hypothetical protein